jgi:hypothetical protein
MERILSFFVALGWLFLGYVLAFILATWLHA